MKFMGKTLTKKCVHVEPNFVCSSIFRKGTPTFPDFGKEVRRWYPVHEYCYDCKKFVEGCNGWNPRKKFECVKAKWYPKVKVV